MNNEFLKINEIPIGSWWAAADGGQFGYCVISIDYHHEDVNVLGTDGKERRIDWFKLQYRYKKVIPNS